jgi:hypothetical protein
MVNFINNENIGGWTIVGWYMKGMTIDVSTENEKVDNDTFQVHLTYLFPTQYLAKAKNSQQFKLLQIEDSTFPNPNHNLPEAPQPAAQEMSNNDQVHASGRSLRNNRSNT